MITFKQQFTYPEELVKGFAIYLGWKEKLTRQVEIIDDDTTTPITIHLEMEEYDNPQSFIDYVDVKAREHTLLFTKSWANKLKTDALNAQVDEFKANIEPTLYTQIIQPVEDALTSEIVML